MIMNPFKKNTDDAVKRARADERIKCEQDKEHALEMQKINIEGTWSLTLQEVNAKLQTAEKRIEELRKKEKDVLKENAAAPEEIREYYEKHRNEWGHEEQVRARHILLPGADEANSVLERLQKGQDFAAEARLHSTAPDAVNGGDMGYVARGQLPDSLEKLLFDLKPGDLSSVIKTPYGFHIFLVVEKREKGEPSMEACIEKITKGMQNERLEAAYGPWLVQLRERYDIEVNKEII